MPRLASHTGIRSRARRIKRIRAVKASWERRGLFWRNHTTATIEFQTLDLLRDIRLALTVIALLLVVLIWQGHRRPIAINVGETAAPAAFTAFAPRPFGATSSDDSTIH